MKSFTFFFYTKQYYKITGETICDVGQFKEIDGGSIKTEFIGINATADSVHVLHEKKQSFLNVREE